jgi:hypothetical protein
MNRLLLATLVLSAGAASAAMGQCSPLTNLSEMANQAGGFLVDEYSDDGRSLFFVAQSDGTLLLYVTGPGDAAHLCMDYTEAPDGTGTLTDGSAVATLACSGGNVSMTVGGHDLKSTTLVITKDGNFLLGGSAAFSRVFKTAFGWDEDGADTMTLNGPVDADHMTVAGHNDMAQSFELRAVHLFEPLAENGDTAVPWLGTIVTANAEVPCGGFCLTFNGASYVLPLMSFMSTTEGVEVMDFLAVYGTRTQHPVCQNWDATAESEWNDYLSDSLACLDTIDAKVRITMEGCASAGVVTCLLSIIPNPITPELCIASLVCVVGDIAYSGWAIRAEAVESQRVRDCVCRHANDRANGASANSCTFTCPSLW